jgi:hypothetical protein
MWHHEILSLATMRFAALRAEVSSSRFEGNASADIADASVQQKTPGM